MRVQWLGESVPYSLCHSLVHNVWFMHYFIKLKQRKD